MSERYQAPAGQGVSWSGKLHHLTDEYDVTGFGAGSFKALCARAWAYPTAPHDGITAETVRQRGFCKTCERRAKQ